MPEKTPAPITVEGRRAADKVRAIFMFIVAANLAIIGIVMWNHFQSRDDAGAGEAIARMERVIGSSIAGYNAGDREGFLKLFSASAVPPADAVFFAGTIQENYSREFGNVTGKTLMPAMTVTTATGGTLVYGLQCEKGGQARLSARFVREADVVKLVEWRIEQP